MFDIGKKVAFYTLGCKTNQYESEAMAGIFRRGGYETVDFAELADVYVINTCTVTHLGDRKSRQMIRRAARKNPDAVIAVTGCYAQTSPGEVLDIPGVDLVIGTRDKNRIVELVAEAEKLPAPLNNVKDIMAEHLFEEMPILDYENRTRAFVKIQEGCNNFCTYCIIPFARGPLKSRDPVSIIGEVSKLLGEGFAEIVLTGIHIGAYGVDLGQDIDLAELVLKIACVPGLRRLRLGSVEPMDISPRLIDAVAEIGAVCRHLHIPLQCGDDRILQRMNRDYSSADFARLISTIRGRVPQVAVTTDVIVGFPGETEEHFQNTYNFVKGMGFSKTHVFKYSPRKGTPAADFPGQVASADKDLRSQRLIALDTENQKQYAARFIGETVGVLVEQAAGTGSGMWEGLTDNYLRVLFRSQEDLQGRFVQVELQNLIGTSILGELKK